MNGVRNHLNWYISKPNTWAWVEMQNLQRVDQSPTLLCTARLTALDNDCRQPWSYLLQPCAGQISDIGSVAYCKARNFDARWNWRPQTYLLESPWRQYSSGSKKGRKSWTQREDLARKRTQVLKITKLVPVCVFKYRSEHCLSTLALSILTALRYSVR